MNDKIKQVLSWLIGIAAIVFLCMQDSSRDVKFVCGQAIIIWGLEIIASLVSNVPYVGGIISLVVSLFCVVMWVMGLIKICQNKTGKDLELPLLGNITNSIFGKIIEK